MAPGGEAGRPRLLSGPVPQLCLLWDWRTWPLWVTQGPEPEPLGLGPPGPQDPLGLDATDLLTTPDPGSELDLRSSPEKQRPQTAGAGPPGSLTPRIELSRGQALGSTPCSDLTQQISQPAPPPLLQGCHTPAQLSRNLPCGPSQPATGHSPPRAWWAG